MNEWKIKVPIPPGSRLRPRGAGRLPHQPRLSLPAAPSLQQEIFWLAVKWPVSQKRRRKKTQTTKHQRKERGIIIIIIIMKIMVEPVGKGGKRAASGAER